MFKLVRSLPLLLLTLMSARADIVRAQTATDSAKAAGTPPQSPKANPASPNPAPAKPAPAKAAAKASTSAPEKAPSKAPDKTAKAGARPGGAGPDTGSAGQKQADVKEVAAGPPPAGSSPLAELKKSNDQLDKLLRKKYPAWSPEGEAQKADVRKLVGGFLDYGELARRALGKHWETLKPAQRNDFVTTLRELVERSYLKQVRGDPNYNIKYQKEEKTGSEATVEATLATVTRGKKVSIALVYKLIYKERWLVYDVITDEQSMLENYRAEFNKIINRDGFDALLKRMKKKLDDKDE